MSNTLTMTIDDASPLITYEPEDKWSQVDIGEDEFGHEYWKESKTWTLTGGATATFHFNGTSVEVLGSKRGNHGNYSVGLDGYNETYSGYAEDPGDYQVRLFYASNLQQGPHKVVLTNDQEGLFLDIDCIHWNSSQSGGNLSRSITKKTYAQDTDVSMHYSPAGAWRTDPDGVAWFNEATGHTTSVKGATLNHTFVGQAVELYGSVGPNNSRFTVEVDQKQSRTLNARRGSPGYGILLFQADNLGAGAHAITLINEDDSLLEIDYVAVYQSNQTILPIEPTPPPSPVENRMSSGAIAGVCIGSVIFFLLFVVLWVLMRRNKTLWYRLHSGYIAQPQNFDFPPSHTQQSSYTSTAISYGIGKPFVDRGPSNSGHKTEGTDTEYDPYREHNAPQPPPVGAVGRTSTMLTDQTASTLVADHGSSLTEQRPRLIMKLVPSWGARGRRRDTPPEALAPQTTLERSSSRRHLLHRHREEDEQEEDFLSLSVETGIEPLLQQTEHSPYRTRPDSDIHGYHPHPSAEPPTYEQSKIQIPHPRGPRPR